MSTPENQPQEQEQDPRVGKTVICQLTNGTNIVARLLGIDYDSGTYQLERPMDFLCNPTPQGLKTAMIPSFSIFGTLQPLLKYDLDNVDVFLVREVPTQIHDLYMESLGEKRIMTPPSAEKSLIIPAK